MSPSACGSNCSQYSKSGLHHSRSCLILSSSATSITIIVVTTTTTTIAECTLLCLRLQRHAAALPGGNTDPRQPDFCKSQHRDGSDVPEPHCFPVLQARRSRHSEHGDDKHLHGHADAGQTRARPQPLHSQLPEGGRSAAVATTSECLLVLSLRVSMNNFKYVKLSNGHRASSRITFLTVQPQRCGCVQCGRCVVTRHHSAGRRADVIT